MATNRLDSLKALIAQDPSNAFVRYGLAMEYLNHGELEQAAAEFRAVLAVNPDYSYAYFHGGQTLEKLNRIDEAGQMYDDGIATAQRIGDAKALAELQAALEMLPL
jgi:tetratricopeptide (TPR) repeat protein